MGSPKSTTSRRKWEVFQTFLNVNIAVGGFISVDGSLSVAGDRALLPNQTLPAENGIYDVLAGAWVRSADANTSSKMSASIVDVGRGAVNGGTQWATNFKGTQAIGTDAMNWFILLRSDSAIPTTQLTGVLQSAQEPAHTGDVTNAAGSLALTIAADAVGNTKLANMAANTLKGNNTGGSADPADLTAAQVKTLLAIASGDVSGLGALATLSSVNLATQVSGILGAANGGTGKATLPLSLGALHGYTETVTAAGTTTLTAASTQFQTFTGTLMQTVVTPIAADVVPGFAYIINNKATLSLTVNANNASNICTIATNECWLLTCILSAGSGNLAWQAVQLFAPGGGGGSPAGSITQVQYNNAGAFAGATEVKVETNQLRLEETTSFTPPLPLTGHASSPSSATERPRNLPCWLKTVWPTH